MELIELNPDNISKAETYLASIGKLQEFQDKRIEPAHWGAIIQFANQQIATQNLTQNNNQNQQ
jgi:hypothetical protein